MKWIILVFFIINFYSSLRFLIGIFLEIISEVKIKKQQKLGTSKASKNFIIMPIYREELVIKDTIEYFQRIIPLNTFLVLVTTDKEKNKNGKNFTYDMALEYSKNYSNISIENYPFKTGNKGDQLNYALEILENGIDDEDYIVLYDADSRPNNLIFQEIEQSKLEGKEIIQQNSIFYSKKENLIGTIEAVGETRWSVGFEKLNERINENNFLRKLLVPYAYCAGHGLFIKRKILKKIGNFPTPNEDVPLGLSLNLKGYTIYSVNSFDYCEVKENINNLFLQQGVWIKAAFISFQILKKYMKDSSITYYRKFMFFLRCCLDVMSWVQYLIFVLLILLDTQFVYLYFILFVIDFTTIVLIKYKFKEKRYKLKYLIMYPVREMLRGVAIVSFLYQKSKGWYYDK